MRRKFCAVLKRPAMNTDLKPTEHFCKITVGRSHTSNLRELEQFEEEEWDNACLKRLP